MGLFAVMDHAYIDANSVAERYLNQALTPEELRAFEEHTVDCQECSDRLLLAEMFHARNGHKPEPDRKMVARLILYKPKRLIVILIAAALAIPMIYLLWALADH
jgi:hypothetical protein